MLSDQGLSCISQSCPYITRISLHNCPSLTDAGLVALGTHCTNLSVIEIAENALISSDGIEGLAHVTCLEHVSVQRCKRVSDRSLSFLSKHPLTYLNFSDNNTITDGGLKLLGLGQGSGSAARGALRTLILRNLFRISDTGIRALSRGCTSLEELDVSGCERLSDASISITLGNVPTLARLSTSRASGDSQRGPLVARRSAPHLRLQFTRVCDLLTAHFYLQAAAALVMARSLPFRQRSR